MSLIRSPILLLVLLSAVPCAAAERDEDRYAQLPEAIRRIEAETGGKVLQVRPIQRGDREIFRMKVLTPDGRVKIVQDDPKRRRDSAGKEPEAEPVPTPARAPEPAER